MSLQQSDIVEQTEYLYHYSCKDGFKLSEFVSKNQKKKKKKSLNFRSRHDHAISR
jgi:pullulanase/glycogen debranching enzyme